jgi:hypothetical protein
MRASEEGSGFHSAIRAKRALASGAIKLERRHVPSRVGPCKVFASN